MKKIFALVVFIFCCKQTYAQNIKNDMLIDYKHSRTFNNNYYGPIKSSRWYYTYVSDSLKKSVISEKVKTDIMYYNRDIAGNILNEFDQSGNLIKTIFRNPKFFDMRKFPLEEKYASYYNYEKKDIESKTKFSQKLNGKYPAYNYYQVIKLNSRGVLKQYEGNIHNNIFVYSYDKFNRVAEEKNYYSINEETNLTSSEKLSNKVVYIYDKKGNLVRQNILQGAAFSDVSFHAMNTESSYCSDLHFSYKYDDKNRLIEMIFFGCGEERQKETYTYDPLADYISQSTIEFSTSTRTANFPTEKTVLHYDKLANLIQKDYIKKTERSKIRGLNSVLPEQTFYKYEFDKYNNWNKCYIYMEGKEGPVTAIIEREIEYY